ncbi:hypothetical protein [uncultured Microbulbifer sp.]|uniref:hypothetical protein n=1 Tax=uncultured Microbulbifer sp. TaxID=348147 RepID=UPI00261F8FAB|nr:hypothetical protein [uncultured Microbulbifer sp.]
MRALLTIFAIVSFSACAQKSENGEIKKVIYTDNFPGLIELGSNYGESKFDYKLDAKDGSTIQFRTCSDIENTTENSVKEDQFPLFTMLNINCDALKHYFTADHSQKTFFPQKLASEIIQQLPASATPNLGGNQPPAPNKKISEAFPNAEATTISPTVVRTNLNGLDIDYTLLARGDLDSDGTEDWIVRLDWSNPSAFGNGYELLLIGANKGRIQLLKNGTN